jgi:hypothetical protein
VPSPDFVRQIADIDAQIADTEARIFQHQKRVENALARGGDPSELQSAIAALTEALAGLEGQKAELLKSAGRG